MRLTYKSIIMMAAASMLLMACSGSDDTANNTANDTPEGTNLQAVTGQFIDAAVAGVHYACSSGSEGTTDFNGTYSCLEGDSVTFSVGQYVLGSATAVNGILTPEAFYPQQKEYALNVAQLLQTIDDGTGKNEGVIVIPEGFSALDGVSTEPTDANFDADMNAILDGALVSETDALKHMMVSVLGGKTFYLAASDPIASQEPLRTAEFDANLTEVNSTILLGSGTSSSSPIRVSDHNITFTTNGDSTEWIGENGTYLLFSPGASEQDRYYFERTAAEEFFLLRVIGGRTFYMVSSGNELIKVSFNASATNISGDVLDDTGNVLEHDSESISLAGLKISFASGETTELVDMTTSALQFRPDANTTESYFYNLKDAQRYLCSKDMFHLFCIPGSP